MVANMLKKTNNLGAASGRSLDHDARARSAIQRHIVATNFQRNSMEGSEEGSETVDSGPFEVLKQAGWSVEAMGFFALQNAAKLLDRTKIQQLLLNGASLVAPSEGEPGAAMIKDRTSPLVLAAAKKHSASVVQLLLDGGAVVDTKGAGGQTALHKAAACGDAEVVRVLLEAGADTELVNASGETALDLAMRYGCRGAETLLRANDGQMLVRGGGGKSWQREDGDVLGGREIRDTPCVGRVALQDFGRAEQRVTVARTGVWEAVPLNGEVERAAGRPTKARTASRIFF